MVNVNGCDVQTCAELAKQLEEFGDKPLFSGNGWYVVAGFCPSIAGIQIAVSACPPLGRSPKDCRNGGR